MESAANQIRDWTPGWTDEERYRLISKLHSHVPAVCIVLFVFSDNPLLRVLALSLVIFTLSSEFILRDCILSQLEQEFSDTTWDDLFSKATKASGWVLTRPEKMTFNIGLNLGLFLMMTLVLLRQSLIWSFPILVLLSLVLFSRGRRSPEIAAPPPSDTTSPEPPPSAQTPPPAVE